MRSLTLLLLLGVAVAQGEFAVLAFRKGEDVEDLLHRHRPAGVILYPSNLQGEDPEALVRRLKGVQPNLLILIDQEGGPFTTYREGQVRFPSAMALGAAGDPGLARRVGQALGYQVCRLGADVNLAPVLDVQVNPKNPIIGLRSFGGDPIRVAELGLAFAQGVAEGGAIPTAKHFPGHGDTAVDSHLDLPVVDKPLERLEATELLPFRKAVGKIPVFMTAHILYKALDPDRPATLSPKVLGGFLRNVLGFDGVVVTDDMAMRAIRNRYPAGEAAVMAVEAGADLVLLSPEPQAREEALWALGQALRTGRISPGRLQASRARLERLRTLKRPCKSPGDLEALALEAARRGVVRVYGRLPLPGQGTLVVAPRIASRYGEESSMAALAERYLPGARGLEVGEDPTPKEVAQAVEMARRAERLVLGTYHWLGPLPEGQKTLYRALSALGKPLYVVALGNPDDLVHLPGHPLGYLATFGYRAVQVRAALEALAGVYTPTGRLPVPVGNYPMGFGGER